jgi:hypothetical protein
MDELMDLDSAAYCCAGHLQSMERSTTGSLAMDDFSGERATWGG